MEINTRNRNELKSYFVRNAIPTESNFADLIDGILNFKDDGIVKRPDSPLSLEAAGANETSEKAAIHFYRDFDSNAPADWVFSLNPFSKPGDSGSARPGFNIADGPGNSRLFIDRQSGNVGLGTTTPAEPLHVNGRIRTGRLTIGDWPPNANYMFFGTNSIDQAVAGNYSLLIDTAGAAAGRTYLNSPVDIRLRINNNDRMVIANDGNVGIGLANPAESLHVNGSVRGNQAGALRISTGNGYVDVGPKNANWSHFYTDRPKYYFNTEITVDTGNIGTYNEDLSLLTSGTARMTILNNNGNVGIGLTNPSEQLDVNGRVKAGNLTIGSWPAGSDYVFFGTNAINQSNGGNYSLLIDTTGSDAGRTFLNSPVDIRFRINNADKMILDGSGNLSIPSNTLSFGSATRQMINLWSTGYGIGVQNGTMYFRSDSHFAWYAGGTHDNATFNPGANGRRLMAVNSAGDLILSGRTNPTNSSSGSSCRALVDDTNKLVLNYGGDFTSVTTSRDFIVQGNLLVQGNAFKPGGGMWVILSDLSLKKNIDSLGEALDKLLQLKGVTFEWKNPENHNNLTGTQMGLIAQDVEKVFPEWVKPDPDGNKAIALVGFEALVIEAIRELNAKVEALSMQLAIQP